MKRVFISVPMRNRSDEAIEKSIEYLHKVAEAWQGEPLTPIHNFVEYPEEIMDAVNSPSLLYLGASIEKMALAECYIGLSDVENFPGCSCENYIADKYGLECLLVRMDQCDDGVFNDIFEEMEKTDGESM